MRTNLSGPFTTLSPRQPLTPSPYSLFASDTAALGGQTPSAFAPASGSTVYVAKTGDTMAGTLNLPEGVEMVMPGDNTTISAELMVPVAIEKGSRFAIREGGRTVGAGTITEIIE